MRIILAMADPTGAIRTALLQDGHHVLHHAPTGAISAWRAQREATAFQADAVLADSEAGDALARRLAIPVHHAVLDPAFLPDPFPPPPFGPASRALPELSVVPPGTPPPAFMPDVVVLTAETLPQAAHWMAATRAIAAPDTEAARALLAHEKTALLHPEDNPTPTLDRLTSDPDLRTRLATAARAEFDHRRAHALAALRDALGGGQRDIHSNVTV